MAIYENSKSAAALTDWMATTPNGLGANQVLFLRALASFNGNDAESFWPVSAI